MAKIDVSEYASILGRLLTASGVLEVTSDLSSEISPVLVLGADRPEWAFLGNSRLLAQRVSVAASAGVLSGTRLRNPSVTSGNGVLAVIDAITAWSGSNANIAFRMAAGTNTDRAATGTAAVRDSRWGNQLNSACVSSGGHEAAVGAAFDDIKVLANTPWLCRHPIILTPGSCIDVATFDLNVDLTVVYIFRERELRAFES